MVSQAKAAAGGLDCGNHLGHVLAEAIVFVLDLERQLTSVAKAHHKDVAGLRQVELLQGGEDEHSRLAHARLRLADHVHTQDGLRDAFVLDCRARHSFGIQSPSTVPPSLPLVASGDQRERTGSLRS